MTHNTLYVIHDDTYGCISVSFRWAAHWTSCAGYHKWILTCTLVSFWKVGSDTWWLSSELDANLHIRGWHQACAACQKWTLTCSSLENINTFWLSQLQEHFQWTKSALSSRISYCMALQTPHNSKVSTKKKINFFHSPFSSMANSLWKSMLDDVAARGSGVKMIGRNWSSVGMNPALIGSALIKGLAGYCHT